MILIFFEASIFFIHLFAYPCGSMHNGHLLDLNKINAFSMEKLSLGNPSIFQALILTGSPTTYIKENFSLPGIFLDIDY
jgi:hypothetical protein